jgi:hypothetical protein
VQPGRDIIRPAVSPPDPFAQTRRKLEDLPSDDGRAVDTLAGAVLRIFARLNEIEHAYGDLRKRVGVLEDRPASNPAPAPTSEHRRTTADGRPDTRGSSAASRFAHRGARSAAG